jgi:hypothetical protein
MSKARDLANAGTALTTVSATELGYLDGVTSAVQTQIDSKIGQSTAINPSTVTTKGDILVATGSGTIVRQGVGTDGQFLQAASAQADGVQWATVSQYSLPTQTGNAGKFLTTNGTSESWGTVSQPITWTPRISIPGNGNVYGLEYNGSLYVLIGGAGYLATSTNGTTWTTRTSGFGTLDIYTVHWCASLSLWIIAGENGTLATSTDGITWTLRTSNMGTNSINHINSQGTTLIGVGRGGGTTNTGGIIYSTDGTTWTRKSQSLTVGATYYMSAWNGTNWVVGASSSTNNYLYASTPSGTWTAGNDSSGQNNSTIYWDGTRHIIGNSGSQVRYSTSTTLGTTTNLNGLDIPGIGGEQGKSLFYYYNGRIYYTYVIYTNFSTTPDSNNTLYPTQRIFSPGGTRENSISSLIWAGSTGIIIVSNKILYTSF